MADSLSLGVDIGGTKVAAGLVNATGEIVLEARGPMKASLGAAQAFDSVRSVADTLLAEKPEARQLVRGIGVCAPGPLDPREGVILNPPNLSCWRSFPLRGEMERAFGLPVRVDNDGNAAALAEAIWGAGVGFENVFYATIGTGIGTGIILDQRIYHGRTGAAAEGGHVVIDYNGPRCACGKRGCIEALAAGPAIARRAQQRLAEEPNASPRLMALAGGDAANVRAEIVGQAFREGDALAVEVLQETATLLAIWLGDIIDLLEPDIIIFGGGVALLISALFPRMREELPRWCMNPRCVEIPLRLASYGADAGIAGAAALCSLPEG